MNSNGASEINLSAIRPDRQEEVRRRLEMLLAFEKAPGRANAEGYAQGLGISVAQFYNLHKAWRVLRDPQALVGRTRARKKSIKLTPLLEKLVQDVLARSPGALPNEITQKVIARAKEASIALPHREKLMRYIAAQRQPGLPADMIALADIVIDYAVLDLPVIFDGAGIHRPLAAFAIETISPSVLMIDLFDGMPTLGKSARVLASAIKNLHGSAHTIAIPAGDDKSWQVLSKALEQTGLEAVAYSPSAYQYGRYAEALLGQRNNGIRLRPRLVATSNKGRALRLPEGEIPLHIDDARALVRARLLGSDESQPDNLRNPRDISSLLEFIEGTGA
ncbi:hypothetical protein ABIE62_002947 [Porphyrobacter sp. MBR-155]|uniref:hypothetical protein n=1 Tax=Porphyrobacter sp. MBR-155 TaxID=3156464 RepID=UPI00339998E9